MSTMRKILGFIIIALLLVSCGNITDEERAQMFLDKARLLYEQKKYRSS